MTIVSTGNSAVISDCGAYRYRLEREVQPDGKVFAYFGVNPSTADASLDDATVRKWRGFTQRNGGRRFLVGNVFAFRSTDVKGLHAAQGPVGRYNERHLLDIIRDADVLVPCWGNMSKVHHSMHHSFHTALKLILGSGKPVMTFGFTKSDDPKHPLMLGYDTPLTPWSAV